jgi:hypothetical protein
MTLILKDVSRFPECDIQNLREELRLRVFENRVLRRICGPKRDETVGGWRKRHNEELHNCTRRQL